MCTAIRYRSDEKTSDIYFPNPTAQLPVRLKNGGMEWLPWGRRKEQEEELPQSGWARLESIQQGRWQRYGAQPVLILANAFMERDSQHTPHWIDLQGSEFIQGLVAHISQELRVYVMTIAAPTAFFVYPSPLAARGDKSHVMIF